MAREILDERKSKELKLVENNVTLELNVERQVSRKVNVGTQGHRDQAEQTG